MSGENPSDNINNLRQQVNSIEPDTATEHEEASATISETVDKVTATAADAAQTVNAKYHTAAEGIRAHPFAAVLGGVAVGFILGRALR
jgi:ElaB/YqjD/DUF883 family membrane-anchored ribosome-binding protein